MLFGSHSPLLRQGIYSFISHNDVLIQSNRNGKCVCAQTNVLCELTHAQTFSRITYPNRVALDSMLHAFQSTDHGEGSTGSYTHCTRNVDFPKPGSVPPPRACAWSSR